MFRGLKCREAFIVRNVIEQQVKIHCFEINDIWANIKGQVGTGLLESTLRKLLLGYRLQLQTWLDNGELVLSAPWDNLQDVFLIEH